MDHSRVFANFHLDAYMQGRIDQVKREPWRSDRFLQNLSEGVLSSSVSSSISIPVCGVDSPLSSLNEHKVRMERTDEENGGDDMLEWTLTYDHSTYMDASGNKPYFISLFQSAIIKPYEAILNGHSEDNINDSHRLLQSEENDPLEIQAERNGFIQSIRLEMFANPHEINVQPPSVRIVLPQFTSLRVMSTVFTIREATVKMPFSSDLDRAGCIDGMIDHAQINSAAPFRLRPSHSLTMSTSHLIIKPSHFSLTTAFFDVLYNLTRTDPQHALAAASPSTRQFLHSIFPSLTATVASAVLDELGRVVFQHQSFSGEVIVSLGREMPNLPASVPPLLPALSGASIIMSRPMSSFSLPSLPSRTPLPSEVSPLSIATTSSIESAPKSWTLYTVELKERLYHQQIAVDIGASWSRRLNNNDNGITIRIVQVVPDGSRYMPLRQPSLRDFFQLINYQHIAQHIPTVLLDNIRLYRIDIRLEGSLQCEDENNGRSGSNEGTYKLTRLDCEAVNADLKHIVRIYDGDVSKQQYEDKAEPAPSLSRGRIIAMRISDLPSLQYDLFPEIQSLINGRMFEPQCAIIFVQSSEVLKTNIIQQVNTIVDDESFLSLALVDGAETLKPNTAFIAVQVFEEHLSLFMPLSSRTIVLTERPKMDVAAITTTSSATLKLSSSPPFDLLQELLLQLHNQHSSTWLYLCEFMDTTTIVYGLRRCNHRLRNDAALYNDNWWEQQLPRRYPYLDASLLNSSDLTVLLRRMTIVRRKTDETSWGHIPESAGPGIDYDRLPDQSRHASLELTLLERPIYYIAAVYIEARLNRFRIDIMHQYIPSVQLGKPPLEFSHDQYARMSRGLMRSPFIGIPQGLLRLLLATPPFAEPLQYLPVADRAIRFLKGNSTHMNIATSSDKHQDCLPKPHIATFTDSKIGLYLEPTYVYETEETLPLGISCTSALHNISSAHKLRQLYINDCERIPICHADILFASNTNLLMSGLKWDKRISVVQRKFRNSVNTYRQRFSSENADSDTKLQEGAPSFEAGKISDLNNRDTNAVIKARRRAAYDGLVTLVEDYYSDVDDDAGNDELTVIITAIQ